MSRTTRLLLGGAALLLLIGGVWFGLTPKAINITECGSPFFPADPAGKNTEADYECAYALNKRYPVLFVVFTGAAALGLAAAVSGMRHRSTPSEERVASP